MYHIFKVIIPTQNIIIMLCLSYSLYIYLFFIFLAEALQCYSCTSSTSWDNCDSNRIEGTCQAGLTKCAKVYAKGNGREVFVRGCESSYQCSTKTGCNIAGVEKCDVYCCDGNLCNGSQKKMASAFVLTACALLAMFAVKTLAE